jgi:hypothetical protein
MLIHVINEFDFQNLHSRETARREKNPSHRKLQFECEGILEKLFYFDT